MAGIKKEVASKVLVGQSDLVIFGEVEDYSAATFTTATATGASVGQVSGDSSEYAGEDAETENWVDEQGDIITSTTKAGTVAIKWSMADLSAEKVELFLKGAALTGLTSTLMSEVKNAVGFGVDLPVITRPIGWFNDEANRCLFLPKAKIVSSLAYDSGHFVINATATAEYINNATLKTAMLFDAKPTYETAAGAGA